MENSGQWKEIVPCDIFIKARKLLDSIIKWLTIPVSDRVKYLELYVQGPTAHMEGPYKIETNGAQNRK